MYGAKTPTGGLQLHSSPSTRRSHPAQPLTYGPVFAPFFLLPHISVRVGKVYENPNQDYENPISLYILYVEYALVITVAYLASLVPDRSWTSSMQFFRKYRVRISRIRT